ncbi:MAG TPA: ATP-binding protein [Myxococcota bacterium]|nr:ATP-binding protein [Myxococcota bacterium]
MAGEASGQEDDAQARTRLGWLLAARLLLAGLSLGLAVTLDRIEGAHDDPAVWGVYWTVAATFFATIVGALSLPRTSNPHRFATIQVACDVGVVTGLVYFSGAGESVFTFLYALVVLYGALFLDRTGVVLSAALAALGYGFVVFGTELGWLPATGVETRSRPLAVLVAYWGFHAGALLMLGMLANTLSAELRRTGAALDRRTSDLRRLRDLHLRTVESIGSGLLTIDGEGSITSFNPEAERITGIPAAEAEGRRLVELLPGSAEILGRGRRGGGGEAAIGRDRIAYRNRRGEDLFLGLAASRLRGDEGDEMGHVVIFQDVTAVVSMEQELRQSERLAAVGEMAARIAHEIRNPLAAISGSVQILQTGELEQDEESERARLMRIVVREVDRLNRLIGDFLRYSRPAPLKLESVRLAGLIEEIVEMGHAPAAEGLEIRLDLDPDVRVEADAAQLTAVVWNLWNNAMQAMAGQGLLTVRVARLAGDLPQEQALADRNGPGGEASAPRFTAMLEIQDSGPGIPEDALEMIFEPFFTTKRDGTGLGLATVQRIVEQHGGSIQAANVVDGGSCFRILLRGTESA